jgi:hypothetical protein
LLWRKRLFEPFGMKAEWPLLHISQFSRDALQSVDP